MALVLIRQVSQSPTTPPVPGNRTLDLNEIRQCQLIPEQLENWLPVSPVFLALFALLRLKLLVLAPPVTHIPKALRNSDALLVCSQANSGSSRPK